MAKAHPLAAQLPFLLHMHIQGVLPLIPPPCSGVRSEAADLGGREPAAPAWASNLMPDIPHLLYAIQYRQHEHSLAAPHGQTPGLIASSCLQKA